MPEPQPVIRAAAKVLLIDPDKRLLLFRGGDPARPDDGTWWFPPGGGIEPGESVTEAARREVWEETGLTLTDLGPIVFHRSVAFEFDGQILQSEEDYFIVKTLPFTISQGGWTDVEREVIVEHRWWTIDELRTTADVVYPEDIVALMNGADT